MADYLVCSEGKLFGYEGRHTIFLHSFHWRVGLEPSAGFVILERRVAATSSERTSTQTPSQGYDGKPHIPFKRHPMTIDQDLEKIALQEKRLQFTHFDSGTAWAIGSALKQAAEKRHAAVAIDIRFHGHPLFYYALPGSTPDNWDWIRRKRNVAMRFHRSSYAVGLKHEKAHTTLQSTLGLDLKDYATHGGCFPIFLVGTGCVGTITVSGLPQRADHSLVASVLQEYLQLTNEDLALDSPAT